MLRDPPDVRYHPVPSEPTWQRVLVSYTAIATVLLLLWAVSDPLASVVLLAAFAVLFAGARWTLALARCLAECGGFAFEVGERVRIRVTRSCPAESC